MDDLYLNAMLEGTGRSRDEIWDDYFDFIVGEEEKREALSAEPTT